MGREGETPGQIFWHNGVQKKWYKLFKLEGGGGRGNLDKIKKNIYFFRETFPNDLFMTDPYWAVLDRLGLYLLTLNCLFHASIKCDWTSWEKVKVLLTYKKVLQDQGHLIAHNSWGGTGRHRAEKRHTLVSNVKGYLIKPEIGTRTCSPKVALFRL